LFSGYSSVVVDGGSGQFLWRRWGR
jgi:hypothetical protein